MADTQHNTAARPVTPNQNRATSSRVLSAPQSISLNTSTSRPLSNVGPLSPVNQNGSFAFDRVIKRGKIERRVKKKGAWRSSWKSAHLVLRPNLLSVYRDSDETELRASITLSDVTAVAPVKKSHHDNVFGIFSPGKNYHFATSSARETSDWIAILRLEARTDVTEELQPPNAGFQQAQPAYDTTDVSADDEPGPPGSPEAQHWSVKGQKNRAMGPPPVADNRKNSGLAPYPSGTEAFTTSQSDLSDAFSSSIPVSKSYLSASVPMQPSQLTPIPDSVAIPGTSERASSREFPAFLETGPPPAVSLSKSMPKSYTQGPTAQDPSRVVRQGYLKLSKTTSGVRQWKTIWVVLRSSTLSFYKSDNEHSPMAIVPVHNMVEAAEIDRKNKQNCFQIISEEKTYRLQAETEDELEKWLGALKSVLAKQEAELSRSRGASLSTSQGQFPQMPTSRDGLGGISTQMKSMTIAEGQMSSARRVISPPTAQPSTHSQVTTGGF